jgi:hypothetical protein
VTRYLQLTFVMAIALPALVCAQQSQSQPSAPPAPASPPRAGDVAARIGDRVVTVEELDKAWRDADAAAQTQAVQALYDGRKQALDRIVADMLIEQAARAKGMAPDAFAREEIGKRTKPITDADVASFYEQNSGQMQGRPLQDMRGAIRNFLQQRRFAEARQALVTELKKGGPAVNVALDPPRQPVTVAATDPARGATNAGVVLVEYSDYQ